MLTALRTLLARFRSFFRSAALDRDFDEELASHEAFLSAEYERRGLAPDAARRAARLQIGGSTGLREAHREVRGLPVLETFVQDVRYSLRALRRDAGFTTFAVLVAGLGIGASVTVFSLVNAVLLRPLPFHDPERLVWIGNRADNGVDEWRVQVAHLLDLREQTSSFEDLAGYYAYYRTGDQNLTGAGEPERLTAVPVSEGFFPLLGVQPQRGRLFTSEECAWNGPRAVLLAHGFWVRRFAANPDVVGRSLILNERPFTIVGVLPAGFNFGSVFHPGQVIDLFTPYPLTAETSRAGNTVAVVGRLRPGVTIDAARAELDLLGAQLTEQHRGTRNAIRPVLTGLAERVNGPVRTALWLLALAVGVVMVIVCANLSNLQLTRMVARQKELAVRVSLGATRRRLACLTLTESLLIACGGALVGLALAVAGVHVVSSLEAFDIPLLDGVRLDATALLFLVLTTVTTGLAVGILPALHLPVQGVHAVLKDGMRGTSTGGRSAFVRKGLVISELALTCVLLVGAGLLMRSFVRVLDVDLGFRPQSVSALRADPPRALTEDAETGRDVVLARNAYYDQILQRTRDIAEIGAAALAEALPLGGDRSTAVRGAGQVFPEGQFPEGFVRVISDGYLETMGIPLTAGRDLTSADALGREPVVLVNETLARTLWPGEEAVGQLMHAHGIYNMDGIRRVVGVVGDVRHRALERTAGAEFYVPIRQTTDYSAVNLVVRSSLPPSSFSSAVRRALAPIAPDLPVQDWQSLQHLVDKAASPRRFVVVVLGGFAAMALVLAALGIYGVVHYSVSQRTAEFGIRLALGATPRHLRNSVVGATLWLAAIGIAVGALAAWLASRLMGALLFDVAPRDPATFAVTILVLIGVATVAGYMPARRAARVDPMTTLRTE
jgi:predicted permease